MKKKLVLISLLTVSNNYSMQIFRTSFKRTPALKQILLKRKFSTSKKFTEKNIRIKNNLITSLVTLAYITCLGIPIIGINNLEQAWYTIKSEYFPTFNITYDDSIILTSCEKFITLRCVCGNREITLINNGASFIADGHCICSMNFSNIKSKIRYSPKDKNYPEVQGDYNQLVIRCRCHFGCKSIFIIERNKVTATSADRCSNKIDFSQIQVAMKIGPGSPDYFNGLDYKRRTFIQKRCNTLSYPKMRAQCEREAQKKQEDFLKLKAKEAKQLFNTIKPLVKPPPPQFWW